MKGSLLVAACLTLVPTSILAAPGDPGPAPRRTGTPDGDGFVIGVVHGTRDATDAHGGFSHTIYMNDCRPAGCTVYPGTDDSRRNRSSIPRQTSVLDAWPHGDAQWDALVRCVRETYAPFDIQVVTTDPGMTANHFEVYVGGDPEDIQFSDALGVAPFIPCGGVIDNVPSFVFANTSDVTDVLCWAVAQETSHVFGLDHELLRDDPMTYLTPPYRKRFKNQAAACGETEAEPRPCECGGATQNSFAFLETTFGASILPPPSVSIVSPRAGAWVMPGFPVQIEADTLLGMKSVALQIDGAVTTRLEAPPYAFNAPATIAPGPHAIAVAATDERDQIGNASVTVQVLAACGSGCPRGTHCLGGSCLPGAATPGGLGSTCAASEECGTGACTSDTAGVSYCTGACDPGNTCPGGFACVGGDGATGGVCWPTGGESGGCSTGGGAGLVLAGLGLVTLLRRRRDRH